MQDRTIDNALLALRKHIIRGNLDGLEHVDALLVARGVDMPRVLPPKRRDVARRGHMALLVLEALRESPKPATEVAAYVAGKRPGLVRKDIKKRTALCLTRLKRNGVVVREGTVWSLALAPGWQLPGARGV